MEECWLWNSPYRRPRYASHRILTAFSTALNSGSPVTSSAWCGFASAAAKPVGQVGQGTVHRMEFDGQRDENFGSLGPGVRAVLPQDHVLDLGVVDLGHVHGLDNCPETNGS